MRKSTVVPLVIFLFALSGMCGLIYEVVWFKYLSLFIGSTTYAQMIVLATFMGGLAAGYYVWGRKADKLSDRLQLYGILEIGIGTYGFFYPYLLGVLESSYFQIAQSVGAFPGHPVLLIMKFVFSFLTLIVPTFLMGGTLPVLVRFLADSLSEAGRDVAMLYFINSLGAVLGTALAGFFLIRIFGLDITLFSTAVFNVLIGVVAVALSSAVKPKEEVSPQPASVSTAGTELTIFPRRMIVVGLVVAGVSGFVVMLYELTWTRLLINIFGSSTYSFSLMLVAFIGGITLGSWLCSLLIHRIKNLFLTLGLFQLGIAVSMLMSLPLYERLPYFVWKAADYFSKTPEAFPVFLTVEMAMTFLIMLVPTLFSGLSLPIVSRIASTDVRILGRSVGGTFAVNTVGTVLGALCTGLLLIPAFGIQGSIELGIVMNALLGILVLFSEPQTRRRTLFGLAVIFGLLFVGYKVFVGPWNVKVTTAGVFRRIQDRSPSTYGDFLAQFEDRKVLFHKEGVNANVTVLEVPGTSGGRQKTLVINGKPDASSEGDLVTQVLLGQVGMMLAPQNDTVLVIGAGSGITAGSVLQHQIEKLDVVEISPEVINASLLFSEESDSFMVDPRTTVFIEDALSYLKEVPRSYDLIISEPSNPWIAGIGNLYSIEYFELCRSRLSDDGLMVQWFHLYEMSDQIFQLVLRTYARAFPYVSVWTTSSMDVLLIGANDLISVDFEQMQRTFSIPSVRQDFERIHIYDVPTFLSLQAISHWNVDAAAGTGQVNSEINPVLEFLAPLAFYEASQVFLLKRFDERLSFLGRDLLLTEYSSSYPFQSEQYYNIGRFHLSYVRPSKQLALAAFSQAHALDPKNAETLSMAYQSAKSLDLVDLQTQFIEKLVDLKPNDEEVLFELAMLLYRRESPGVSFLYPSTMDRVVSLLKRCVELTKDQTDQYVSTLGDVLNRTGKFDEAISYYEQALDHRRRGLPHNEETPTASIYLNLAIAYYNNRDLPAAERNVLEVLASYPGERTAKALIARIERRKNAQFPQETDVLTYD